MRKLIESGAGYVEDQKTGPLWEKIHSKTDNSELKKYWVGGSYESYVQEFLKILWPMQLVYLRG